MRTSNIDANIHSAFSIQHSAFLRGGVTLIEVLIAAGVTAIGLFGVLAVIPLAAVQVGKGVTEDRKSVLGKNAISEMHIRGYRRPENWLRFDTTAGNFVPAYVANAAFCLDPRFVAAQQATPVFPYPAASTAGIVAMSRITLRSSPGGGAMNAALADEIFRSQDDLEFLIPEGDRTQPAVQIPYPYNPTTNPPIMKRQSTGNYSWMATLVPKHGLLTLPSDEYVLSVVTFYKRDQNFTINDSTTASDARQVANVNERVLQVAAFSGAGVGGGEVRLQAATQFELEAIPNNSWIMLAAQTADSANNTMLSDFRWYRVLATDDIIGAGPFTRNLTLQGADWQRPEWAIGATNFRVTQATIMANVVGVFEKTIRLETTSLWSN